MWNITDPNVKRFRCLCDDKCNMVGNVYMYTNPQIAPLNLRKKKHVCIKTKGILLIIYYIGSYSVADLKLK